MVVKSVLDVKLLRHSAGWRSEMRLLGDGVRWGCWVTEWDEVAGCVVTEWGEVAGWRSEMRLLVAWWRSEVRLLGDGVRWGCWLRGDGVRWSCWVTEWDEVAGCVVTEWGEVAGWRSEMRLLVAWWRSEMRLLGDGVRWGFWLLGDGAGLRMLVGVCLRVVSGHVLLTGNEQEWIICWNSRPSHPQISVSGCQSRCAVAVLYWSGIS